MNDIKHNDVDNDATSISSDLSRLDENTDDDISLHCSELSYDDDDDNDNIEDSLTTVTYMSDFTIFLQDYSSVESVDDFSESEIGEDNISPDESNKLNGRTNRHCTLSDIVHIILDEMIANSL